MSELTTEQLDKLDKIEDYKRLLKKKSLSKKYKIQLLDGYGNLWDSSFTVNDIPKIFLQYLRNSNEDDDIRIVAIKNLKNIGFYIFIFEQSLELEFNLLDMYQTILNENIENHPKLITELLKLFEVYLQEISSLENNQNPDIERYIKDISFILKEVLHLPEKINDKNFLIEYFNLNGRALTQLNNWESKFGKTNLSQVELWKKNEFYIIENLSNENFEVRLECAKILQNHGRNKGEKELLEAIKKETYSFVIMELMRALVQIGFRETRFAFMKIMQSGNSDEKKIAENSLNELSRKFGYLNGYEMITKLAPLNKLTPREWVSIITGFFSSIGILSTIIGFYNSIQPNNVFIYLAIAFAIISVIGLIVIPVELTIKKNKYNKKLEEWNIEGFN